METVKQGNHILIILSLIVASLLAISGCSANSYTYLKGTLEDYTMRVEDYQLQIPESAETAQKFNSDMIELKDDSYGTIDLVVSSNVNNETIAEYISLDTIDNYYNFDRVSCINSILDGEEDLEFEAGFEEAQAANYSSLMDKGVFLYGDVQYDYASYDFFLDEEELVPCEVFAFSADVDQDALSAACLEVIGTIK